MGVQVEHLWEVLLRQARVDFFITTFQYSLIMLFCFSFYKWRKRYHIEDDGTAIIITLLWGSIVSLLLIAMFFDLPSYISSIANPEYWALAKVLEFIGNSK